MKILATGCVHSDDALVHQLVQTAQQEQVDLVVICGDLTLAEHNAEGVIKPFVDNNIPVAFVPGNHESVATADFLEELFSVKNLHGSSLTHGEIGFFGCGGANIGLHQLSETEIFELLSEGHERIKSAGTRVMVTHNHPADTKMAQMSKFVIGSSGVKKAVEMLQPDLLLCAHVHEASGLEEQMGKTRVINVAKRGTIIDL